MKLWHVWSYYILDTYFESYSFGRKVKNERNVPLNISHYDIFINKCMHAKFNWLRVTHIFEIIIMMLKLILITSFKWNSQNLLLKERTNTCIILSFVLKETFTQWWCYHRFSHQQGREFNRTILKNRTFFQLRTWFTLATTIILWSQNDKGKINYVIFTSNRFPMCEGL